MLLPPARIRMLTRNRLNLPACSFPLPESSPALAAKHSIAVILLAASLLSSCKPAPQPSASEPQKALEEAAPAEPSSSPAAAPLTPPKIAPTRPAAFRATLPAKPAPPGPYEIWKEFSGDKAFAEARSQVDIGPRPSGSPEIARARALIEKSLGASGWDIERQSFTDETPRGPLQFVNIIARFSPNGRHPALDNTQKAIVCSHYDTKLFSTIRFVGASVGASTGAALELARVLALDPVLASKIELVFFDGEEPIVQSTAPEDPHPDGLYGSRYYAKALRAGPRLAQFKFGILWDMIGSRDLTITLPPDTPAALSREIMAAAEALQLRNRFTVLDRPVLDDDWPLTHMGRIPTINLIDFDYTAWHTADDNLERIGPESLQQVGAVTLYQLRKALGR